MKTIVIASQKGGSGKSTLAAHLSVEAERNGKQAWLIDTDQQATLSLWHERRQAETPQRAEMPFTKLREGLETLSRRKVDYCFIDTPPTVSAQNEAVIELADLVLIPVRPSPSDLWAVAATVEIAKKKGKAFLFVMTQAKHNASITAQAVAALSEHGRVAKSFIGDRVSYAVSMTGGATSQELQPNSAAALEIGQLWRDIHEIMI